MSRTFELPPFEPSLPRFSAVIVEALRCFNAGAFTTLDGVREWIRSSITPVEMDELARFAPDWLDPELVILLRMMMLADCDGWELLNVHTCNEYRQEIRAVFDRIQA